MPNNALNGNCKFMVKLVYSDLVNLCLTGNIMVKYVFFLKKKNSCYEWLDASKIFVFQSGMHIIFALHLIASSLVCIHLY